MFLMEHNFTFDASADVASQRDLLEATQALNARQLVQYGVIKRLLLGHEAERFDPRLGHAIPCRVRALGPHGTANAAALSFPDKYKPQSQCSVLVGVLAAEQIVSFEPFTDADVELIDHMLSGLETARTDYNVLPDLSDDCTRICD